MKGFRKFLMQGNIVSLAVAVVIGVAFNAIVQALVKDMITPMIAAITGNSTPFASMSFTVRHATFTYGAVINAALSFFVIAIVVYYLIVAPTARLSALASRNKAATDRQCPECLSMIPVGARRCMYCTADLTPAAAPAEPPQPRRIGRHGYLAGS